MAVSPPLARNARRALLLLGAVFVLAALWFGYIYLINVVVGLTEPVRLTPLMTALVISEGLFPFLLLAGGVASLMCRTRRRLRPVVALVAAAAVNLGVSLLLYVQYTHLP